MSSLSQRTPDHTWVAANDGQVPQCGVCHLFLSAASEPAVTRLSGDLTAERQRPGERGTNQRPWTCQRRALRCAVRCAVGAESRGDGRDDPPLCQVAPGSVSDDTGLEATGLFHGLGGQSPASFAHHVRCSRPVSRRITHQPCCPPGFLGTPSSGWRWRSALSQLSSNSPGLEALPRYSTGCFCW